MREEFEKWCEEELNLRTIRLTTGDYQSFGADMAWRAWQTVYKRLSEAEKLLRGVHTGDLFGPEDWETVNTFLNGSPPPKICECGPLRNITEGGHFPACTRCHRRLKP